MQVNRLCASFPLCGDFSSVWVQLNVSLCNLNFFPVQVAMHSELQANGLKRFSFR